MLRRSASAHRRARPRYTSHQSLTDLASHRRLPSDLPLEGGNRPKDPRPHSPREFLISRHRLLFDPLLERENRSEHRQPSPRHQPQSPREFPASHRRPPSDPPLERESRPSLERQPQSLFLEAARPRVLESLPGPRAQRDRKQMGRRGRSRNSPKRCILKKRKKRWKRTGYTSS